MSEIYLNMAQKVTSNLSQKGVTCTSYNIFSHIPSDITFLKIIEYTNQELVLMGHPITNLLELLYLVC